jgi:SAM-dependent methyltransferase
MHRRQISTIAHTDHPVAAPLRDDSVRALLDRALPSGDARLLDLGCGSGTWLMRAHAARPGLRADGVDSDSDAIAAAERAADEAGFGDRIAFHAQDAAEFGSPHRYDLVLSIGAAHAFGGLLPTLTAAGSHLAPGGTVLLGDCFWERAPGPETLDAGFAVDDYDDLATTVDRAWPPAGSRSTGTSAPSRSGTTTSGPGRDRSPAGPSTTRTTPTTARPSTPRPATATPGCTATGARSASSPCSCAARPGRRPAGQLPS